MSRSLGQTGAAVREPGAESGSVRRAGMVTLTTTYTDRRPVGGGEKEVNQMDAPR